MKVVRNSEGSSHIYDDSGKLWGVTSDKYADSMLAAREAYDARERCNFLNAGISKWWPAYVQSRSRRFGMSYVPARHVRGWTPE